MPDKTTIGISNLLRQFIGALVEEVVLEGKPFDNQKKSDLQSFSQEEGVDYVTLEKNLTEFFETVEELKSHESKAGERFTKILGKNCYLEESKVDELLEEQSKPKDVSGTANGHDYVDLGLPSGTLWATCNIGASKPEDYGDYYAWGEIKQKAVYEWDTYKYSKIKQRLFKLGDLLTKYCNESEYGYKGFTDELMVLQSADDPATTNWGVGWRMPTKEEWIELIQNTTNRWMIQNGVFGWLFTADNGNNLFLPAAGFRQVSSLSYAGRVGRYWSSTLFGSVGASHLHFSNQCYMDSSGRFYGQSVRPVRSSR